MPETGAIFHGAQAMLIAIAQSGCAPQDKQNNKPNDYMDEVNTGKHKVIHEKIVGGEVYARHNFLPELDDLDDCKAQSTARC